VSRTAKFAPQTRTTLMALERREPRGVLGLAGDRAIKKIAARCQYAHDIELRS